MIPLLFSFGPALAALDSAVGGLHAIFLQTPHHICQLARLAHLLYRKDHSLPHIDLSISRIPPSSTPLTSQLPIRNTGIAVAAAGPPNPTLEGNHLPYTTKNIQSITKDAEASPGSVEGGACRAGHTPLAAYTPAQRQQLRDNLGQQVPRSLPGPLGHSDELFNGVITKEKGGGAQGWD
ncbi:hypothetical protein BU16DRAFT_560000 [Lophium mytilinum]|uniref:Uncharacterized protein n=1 Tax=Lophium mytilinum TaxID=390894 RepID=A0A6A6QWS3_9PEZI|nr:hypothetical protein BU16DRAFT_560000 [Lophium mytilinum]